MILANSSNSERDGDSSVVSSRGSVLTDRQVTINESDSTEKITLTLDRASPDLIGRILEAIGRIWTDDRKNS